MSRRGWALFAAMAVIWGIPYLLIKVAVGELSPVTLVLLRTSIGALYVNPAVALAVGVVVLGDRVTLGAIVGFPLILLGMVLATQRQRSAGARSEPGERARAGRAA